MSRVWFVYKDKERKGPFTRQEIHDQVLAGEILPDDRVWSPETSGWVPGKNVDGLFPTEAPSIPPPDAPPPVEAPKATVEPAHDPRPVVSAPAGNALTVGQYFLFLLLCAIPVVNLVLLLVWSFGPRTCAPRKNLARAVLILGLVAGVVGLAVYGVWILMGGE